MTTRRTLLTALGLAPAASAIGAESFLTPNTELHGVRSVNGAYDKGRFARALELMADKIRNGSITVSQLTATSSLEPYEIADSHILTVKFIYTPEQDT